MLLAALAVGRTVSFILTRRGQRLRDGRFATLGKAVQLLGSPAALLIFGIGLWLAGSLMELQLDPERNLRRFWVAVAQTVIALAVGWAIYRLVEVLEVFMARWTSRTRTQLDDQLVPMLRKSLRLFIVIIVFLFIAQNIYQWDIGALLAGLGLGGLAFALAAQDALKNLFGSVVIFSDRPFQLGDWVRIAEHEGFVEEVGFRSTRLRTFDGYLVTLPNSTVANSPVVNVARRPSIRRVLNVTITYDTPPEKVQRAVDIIQEMLDARKDHWQEDRPPRVYFNDFNAASLNMIVFYWYAPPNWWDYMAFNHDFNMELLKRFNEEGIEFAFPTQTLYLKQASDFSADVSLRRGDLPQD
ncbi:MAG: hypothetical protein AMK72_02090 [Planctomycetes bacterium SM23_25]|nr:MAG: hypothetical protein AMK72_02090 [Planctomycetes bacterium SM23_25]